MFVPKSIHIDLPESINDFNQRYAGKVIRGIEAQMELAVNAAMDHIKTEGCGPFWAIVVSKEDDRILCGAGNFVVGGRQSWMHGERLVFSLGQLTLNEFMFPPEGYRLVTTAAMCIGCYGESLGSGISEIVAGARGADVESLTPFKEGRLPEDWKGELANQGIAYVPNSVLRMYTSASIGNLFGIK